MFVFLGRKPAQLPLAKLATEADLLWLETASPTSDPLRPPATTAHGVAAGAFGASSLSALASRSGPAPGTASAEALEPPSPSASASAAQTFPSLFIANPASIGLEGPGSYRIETAEDQPTEAERLSEITRRSIVDPLRAHEQQNGGRGGPVVAAVEQTARRGLTPNFGRAVFAINVDALGVVVSVGVEDASSDRNEWEGIATQSLTALAQKRVHLPPGSKGARIRVEVTSRVQMPSGSTRPVTITPFGSADPQSPSVPLLSGSFDLSDIGAHPLRVVGARELSESIY